MAYAELLLSIRLFDMFGRYADGPSEAIRTRVVRFFREKRYNYTDFCVYL